jgi:two-component system sensor histidine kinase HydH
LIPRVGSSDHDPQVMSEPRPPEPPRACPSPGREAAKLMLTYLVVCACYIWISTKLAARSSISVEALEDLELIKGFAFVATTSALLFVLAYALLDRIRRREREVLLHREALLEAERRAVAGVFASSVAHDIKNVLTILGLEIDALRAPSADGATPGGERGTLGQAVDQLAELSRRLMVSAKAGAPGGMQSADLAEITRRAADFARRHTLVRHAKVEVEGDEAIVTAVHPATLHQMLLNLILNAGEATAGRGRISIRIGRSNGSAALEVHDDGPGIPADRRGSLFEPFRSSHGEGRGLGLFSVKAGAEAHGGRVEVDASPLGGALFRILLPLR